MINCFCFKSRGHKESLHFFFVNGTIVICFKAIKLFVAPGHQLIGDNPVFHATLNK